MSDDLNNQPCTSPHHIWLMDMPVNDITLGKEENSAVPTASINIGEFGESSATGELGGRSVAEGGENNSFHVDEALERQEICPRRTRFIWTDEYHRIFTEAVDTLTLQRAVPRKILEYMKNCGVPNITRAVVASHLQKYRMNLKKGEVDKALMVPSRPRTISFRRNQRENMRNQEGNLRNQEGNLRNQEGNMRNQEGNMRYQEGNMRYQEGNMRYQEGNMRYQEGNMRYQEGNLRYQEGNLRYQEVNLRYQEVNLRNQEENMRNQAWQENQVWQENYFAHQMTQQQQWPLFESLSRPGLTQPNISLPNISLPHFFHTNEPNHLQNLPNQFPGYVDGNNNYNAIPSPNQTRYADGNNNNNVNNVIASDHLINDGLSNHVSNNDPHHLKMWGE